MRTKLVLLVSFVLLAVPASAQWVGTSPGPIYYNGGRVGIGVTNPQWDLDVSGTIGVSGPSAMVRTSSNSDSDTLTFLGTRLRLGQINSRAYGYTGTAVAYIGGFANGVELLRINSNLGTGNMVVTQAAVDALLLAATNTNIRLTHTDPASALNIIEFMEGSTLHGFVNQRGTTFASAPGLFNIGNNTGAMSLWAGASERVRVLANGNVGIATTNPGYTLDVNGTGRVSGQFYSASLMSSAASTIATDVTGVNPILTIRVGDATGYYPTLNFNNEANGAIGALFGWKGNGLILRGGPAQGLMFRVNNSGADSMIINAAGNVGIGGPASAARVNVTGDMNVTGTVTGGNVQAKYQDVAEWVPAATDMTAGTVVVLDRTVANQVKPSARPYDTAVAGVVSEQPGVLLGEAAATKEMIATTGRVKVKVDATRAPIEIGDLLVTSRKPGMAMRSEPLDFAGTPLHRPGTVIGKALEALPAGEGEILVLLSLQ